VPHNNNQHCWMVGFREKVFFPWKVFRSVLSDNYTKLDRMCIVLSTHASWTNWHFLSVSTTTTSFSILFSTLLLSHRRTTFPLSLSQPDKICTTEMYLYRRTCSTISITNDDSRYNVQSIFMYVKNNFNSLQKCRVLNFEYLKTFSSFTIDIINSLNSV